MAKSRKSITSVVWGLTLAVLAASLTLNFAVNTLRCAWPWIVGTATVVAVVALITWRLRGRGDHW